MTPPAAPAVVHRNASRGPGSRVARVAVVLGVATAAYLGFAAWLWLRQPTIAFDPVARVQGLVPMAPEGQEAAWPHYKRALEWLTALRHSTNADIAEMEALQAALRANSGDPAWPQAVALVQQHRDQMAQLRQAAALPTLGFKPSIGTSPEDADYFGVDWQVEEAENASAEFPAFAMLLPQLLEIRQGARLLRLDALEAAQAGDGARVVQDVQAMMRMAAHASQVPLLICNLVDYAVLCAAAETVIQTLELNAAAFKPADLAALDEVLAGVTIESTRLRLEGERVGMDDVLQRIYTDDGRGSGGALPARFRQLREYCHALTLVQAPTTPPSAVTEFLAGPLVWAGNAGRAQVRERWEAIFEEAEAESIKPARLQRHDQEDLLHAMMVDSALTRRYYPMSLLAPAVSLASRASSDARMAALEARTRVALQRYHADTGKWPATLDALAPKYLPQVPADEFAEGPLGYEVHPEGPCVRSARHHGHEEQKYAEE